MRVSENHTPFDCIVIGGGPAGLTAAVYLARYHLSVMVVDSGKSRAALIPVTHNLAGFPGGIAGTALLERMQKHAVNYGACIKEGLVRTIAIVDNTIVVATEREEIFARTVLLATGVTNIRPDMLEDIHNEALARGLIRYCPVCDGFEVTDQRVAVLGTGEHGLREAEFLRSFTADLSLISPVSRHSFNRNQYERVNAAGIELIEGGCRGFELNERSIAVRLPVGERLFDSLYPALGTTINSDLALQIGATLTKDGCPVVDPHQRMSVKGVYAAGDVVLGLDQISSAMGQASVAAIAIRNDLDAVAPLRRSIAPAAV